MEGISVVHSPGVSLNSIVRASSGTGRINLPVPASVSFYSGFKHISVIPVPGRNGAEGFSISKLRALDNLIEMLASTGQPGAAVRPGPGELTSEKVDSLIAGYTKQIKDFLSVQKLYKPVLNLKGLFVNGLI